MCRSTLHKHRRAVHLLITMVLISTMTVVLHNHTTHVGAERVIPILPIIYVDADATGTNTGTTWQDAYTDLQDGLAAADAGDEIWVAEGTYTPTDGDDRHATFQLQNGVGIYGGFAGTETERSQRDWEANPTILSGDLKGNDQTPGSNKYDDNSYHVVTGSGTDATAVLDGLTITRGRATGPDDADRQGAGMVNDRGSPTLTNLIFNDNEAGTDSELQGWGGGMYNANQSTPTLTNVTFRYNNAHYGCGLYNRDSTLTLTSTAFIHNGSRIPSSTMHNVDSHVTITDTEFLDNNLTNNCSGFIHGITTTAGITTIGGELTIQNARFEDNIGVALQGENFTIRNALFKTNQVIQVCLTRDDGGGIHGTDGTIINSTFIANHSRKEGGAILGDNLTIINSTFIGNSSDRQGGAIWGDNLTIINSTFANNHAMSDSTSGSSAAGAAIYATNTDISNSIFWNNTAVGSDEQIQGDATVTHSLVQGGYAGTGNIDADPLFVRNPHPGVDGVWGKLDTGMAFAWTTADNDYGDVHLLPGSPTIDAGSNAALPDDITTDLDGNPRILGSSVDMGPYELYPITYVDADATGTNDGTTWQDAYTDLQDGLAAAQAGDEIWVAEGTYTPTDGHDRHATFPLQNGVRVYGGFTGTETEHRQRDWEANPTILSGNIGKPNTMLDNSYHVVTARGTDATTVLDGFTITSGQAWGWNDADRQGAGMLNENGSPTLTNLIFKRNRARHGGGLLNRNSNPTLTNVTFVKNGASLGCGGMLNDNSSPAMTDVAFIQNRIFYRRSGGGLCNINNSTPTLRNGIFRGNKAAGGGGIWNSDSSPTIINSLFMGNSAIRWDDGGGILNQDQSSPTIINSTFVHNNASLEGGGIASRDRSHAVIHNSIFWDNTAMKTNPHIDGDATVSHSLVQGGYAGTGNIDADPRFIRDPHPGADGWWMTHDDDYGDLYLRPGSPAIDAGSTAALPDDSTTDLDGNPRLLDSSVDMGTYERRPVIYVDADATGTNNGTMWEHAYTDLQNGLATAEAEDEIWVAAGTYTPGDDRHDTFQLQNGVGVYGGFAGTETRRNQRDWEANPTILSGDLNGNDETDVEDKDDDNSYHIVTGSGTDATTVLDGFTITSGRATETGHDHGAGMFNENGSPTLTNLIFSHNHARVAAGMYNYNSNPSLTNVTFRENSTSRRCAGMLNHTESSPTMTNVTFIRNRANTWRSGGGLCNSNKSSPTLRNARFYANVAEDGGGILNARSSSPIIINSLFVGNQATIMHDGGGIGGAIYNMSGSSPIIINSTFAFNHAHSRSGIFNFQYSDPVIQNSIFWGNTSDDNTLFYIYGKKLTIHHSLVQGGYAGMGNIDADPRFVRDPHPGADGQWATEDDDYGDLHLQPGSPAIDAGSIRHPQLPDDITTDLDGAPRIVGSSVDMGAYEWRYDADPGDPDEPPPPDDQSAPVDDDESPDGDEQLTTPVPDATPTATPDEQPTTPMSDDTPTATPDEQPTTSVSDDSVSDDTSNTNDSSDDSGDPDTVEPPEPDREPVTPVLLLTTDCDDTITAGAVWRQTLTYKNSGETRATGVKIGIVLPRYITLSMDAESQYWVFISSHAARNTNGAVVQQEEAVQRYFYHIGDLDAGAEGRVTLALDIAEEVPTGTQLTIQSSLVADEATSEVQTETSASVTQSSTTFSIYLPLVADTTVQEM